MNLEDILVVWEVSKCLFRGSFKVATWSWNGVHHWLATRHNSNIISTVQNGPKGVKRFENSIIRVSG